MGMRELESGADLRGIVDHLGHGESFGSYALPKSAIGKIFESEEGFTVPLAGPKKGGDVGMVERGNGQGFTGEARQCVGGSTLVGAEEFQGNDAVEFFIASFEDHAHPTLAALLQEFVLRMFGS